MNANDKYAVIGNPIEHSKSPLIHAAFARQTGQDMEYGRILGDPRLSTDVRRFFAEAGRGMNVTVPFKEQAWEIADERSPRAESAGAVNTLILLPDAVGLRGDNTDGVGLVRDLIENHGFDFDGKRLLLLGAGGASRGVLRPLWRPDWPSSSSPTAPPPRPWTWHRLEPRWAPSAVADWTGLAGRQLRPHRQRHLRRARWGRARHPGRVPRPRRLGLRHALRGCADPLPALGHGARGRFVPWTGSACWWSRPRSPSSCGAACVPQQDPVIALLRRRVN